MSEINPATHAEQTPAAQAPTKKKRAGRPYWLLVPVPGTQTFEVHTCLGKAAVRKLLTGLEIDSTDERINGIKLLRADEVPLNWEAQVVFKFGKAAEGDENDESEGEAA